MQIPSTRRLEVVGLDSPPSTPSSDAVAMRHPLLFSAFLCAMTASYPYGRNFFGGAPLGPWPFASFGPLPGFPGMGPIRFSGWTRRPYALNGADVARIVEIVEAMNVSTSDYDELMDAAYRWNFTQVYDFMYTRAMQLAPKLRSQALRLIEQYGPPLSFIDALSALTVEQKAHVEELVRSRNQREIDRVTRGLVASIPYEDQHQARKFESMLHYVFGDL
ncbi:hypothetical protein QR680_013257 [Steinernema hermaphroditum]|uniref:Uncharacterized protein n=1 Tax=Steinernema hermaphroditum TaxID=289476 RepID=A0AA39I7I0_9BILA|nr:hypothetical protein QR680_013257 [Steinernema hermaphroditum]